MNNNPVLFKSDSEGIIFSFSRRGVNFESNSFFFFSRDFKLEIIPLIDDSKMEGTSRESLSDEVPSRDSLETLFLVKPDRGENLVEGPMPPIVLPEAEIDVVSQMREIVVSFAKTYRGVTGCEPINAEVARRLEFQGQFNIGKITFLVP